MYWKNLKIKNSNERRKKKLKIPMTNKSLNYI